MGRPSKLTPEVQERICQAIRAGNYYEAACAYAGIGYSTFRAWMIKGEKAKSGKYREFMEAVTRAEHEAEARMVALWQKHMPEDYRAIRDFLERRYPERWGKRVDIKQDIKQEVQGQVTQRHEYDITHRVEQYADVYRQLARRGVFCGSDEGDDTGEPLDTA
jgi:transposase